MTYIDTESMTPQELAEFVGESTYDPKDYDMVLEMTPRAVPNYEWDNVVEYFEESAHGFGPEEVFFDPYRLLVLPDTRTIIVRVDQFKLGDLLNDLAAYIESVQE